MNRILLALALHIFVAASWAQDDIGTSASKHYELALKSFEEQQLPEAFIHLQNALSINPEYLSAKILLAKVYFNDGNLYAAEEEFEECLLLGSDINLILPLYGSTLVLLNKPDTLFSLQAYARQFTKQTQFEWSLLKGQAHISQGNDIAARDSLEDALSIYPDNTRAINTLASFNFEIGMVDAAYTALDRSIAIDANNEKSWQLKGEFARKTGDLDAAIKYFARAYAIDDSDPRILRSMARTHLDRRELADAKLYLGKILEQSPDDPSASLLNAIVLLAEGNETLGMDMLATLGNRLSNSDQQQSEDNSPTLFVRATTEYIQGNTEKASTLLSQYLGNNPADVAAIRMLVDLYLGSNSTDKAIQLLQSHQKHTNEDAGLILQLANLYVGEGKLFTAEQELEKLGSTLSSNPYVTMLRADILNARLRPDEALKLMNAQQFEQDEPLAFTLKKGLFELNSGATDLALATSERLLVQHPDNNAVLNFAAATNMKMGRLDQAKTFLTRVIDSNSLNLSGRFNLALLNKMKGEAEAAASSAKQILSDSPQHIPTILLLAQIRMEQGNFEEALEWTQKVYAYDRVHIGANELKFDIYTATGDWDNALKTTRFLYKNGSNPAKYLVQEAELLASKGKFEQAQKPLYLLFSLWEDEPKQLTRLAQLQVGTKNIPAARNSLERAAELDPKSLQVQVDLARLLLLEKRIPEAKAAIAQLRQQFGGQSQIETLDADLALQSQRRDLARIHYTKAFHLDTRNDQALIMLYQLTLDGVGESEFTKLLENHIRSKEVAPWVIRLLADSYLNQNDFPKGSGPITKP